MARGERVLATSIDEAGRPTLGTTRALYYRPTEPDAWVRVGWEELDRVRWHPETGTLTVFAIAGSIRPPVDLHLGKPGRLVEVSRARIAAAAVATNRVTVGSGGAVITVRRASEADTLVWTVRLSSDLDSTDPQVQRQVDAAIHAMRADLGL